MSAKHSAPPSSFVVPASAGPLPLTLPSGSAFWLLFEHMSQAHGLTLLDSELADVCAIVDKMRSEWEANALHNQLPAAPL